MKSKWMQEQEARLRRQAREKAQQKQTKEETEETGDQECAKQKPATKASKPEIERKKSENCEPPVEQDGSDIEITDEQENKFQELMALYLKPWDDPDMLGFKFKENELWEWLMNKSRAMYDLIVFANDQVGEEGFKHVNREHFSLRLACVASDYFTARVRASWEATLAGVFVEMDANIPAMIATVFGQDESTIRKSLITVKEWDEIQNVVRRPLRDPNFVRDARGGNRRSEIDLSTDEKRAFVARVDALRPVWKYITKFFDNNEYESGCLRMLADSARFAEITRPCLPAPPADLLVDAFRRRGQTRGKTDRAGFLQSQRMPDELSPLAFALTQTAREMGLSEDYEARRKNYQAWGKATR